MIKDKILGEAKCYFGTDLQYIEKNTTTEKICKYIFQKKSNWDKQAYQGFLNVWKYIYDKRIANKEYQDSANKIGDWFLKCKYNPEYNYCKNMIWDDFVEIYED